MFTPGFPRNLGSPVVSMRRSRKGPPATKTPGRTVRPCERPGETKPLRHAWYRQAKETKCGGRDVRESEHLIVPMKQGTFPQDPVEASGCRIEELFEGNMARTSNLGTVSMRQERIATLARSAANP